jgi:hypothetical protein
VRGLVDVDITAQGPDDELDFSWTVHGSGTWYPETIGVTGSTYSTPSMDLNGNEVNISAAGSGGSLLYYWKVIGSGGWNSEEVAPAGSVG